MTRFSIDLKTFQEGDHWVAVTKWVDSEGGRGESRAVGDSQEDALRTLGESEGP